MEFARNWNGHETDVIRFRPNRTPLLASPNQEWLARESEIPVELLNKSIEALRSVCCDRHLQNGDFPAGLLPKRGSDKVSDNLPVETEIVAQAVDALAC
jgi:hypothetical protein